jgi:superfamily I DNA/RNA helicase
MIEHTYLKHATKLYEKHTISSLQKFALDIVAEVVKEGVECAKATDEARGSMDFDDWLYMPIYCGAKLPKFDIVMVDEAQDCDDARLAIVQASLKPKSMSVFVGDRLQSINIWSGAISDALLLIVDTFKATEESLPCSHRCPKSHVEKIHGQLSLFEEQLDKIPPI